MSTSELIKFDGDILTFNDGKITSVTLTEGGGIVNVTGNQDIYGLIYLTYHLTLNPKADTQGAFTGKALGYGPAGERVTATLSGVWVRRERTVTLYSIDDVSDGNFHFARVELNLDKESDSISFLSIAISKRSFILFFNN